MVSKWKHYDPLWAQYEKDQPPAFPWNRDYATETRRYVKGTDGWWYDPTTAEAGSVLLSCAGDLMCEPRLTAAYRYGDSYFFQPLFQYVRDIFRSSDLSVANLETTLTDKAAYAGDYHCIAGKYHCNGPQCYLDAVCYAGFDALITANNHNCDSGIGGLWDTLRSVDRKGLMRTGTFLPEEAERVLLVNVKGFRIAILAYGNRYNGLDERHYTEKGVTQTLNWFSKERCLADVAYAREKGAEFVLCYQHWGKDYVLDPNEQQCAVLEELKECGIDYIVGSHTHCLQKHDVAVASDGKQIPMMWSMGNFVTNERKTLCRHTGILQLTLEREGGKIAVKEHFVPCYVHDRFGTGRFCVVPTDTTLNGGWEQPEKEAKLDFIRDRVGNGIDFLPDRSMTLSGFCKAMDLQTDLPDRPITKLSVQSADLSYGALYFAFGPLSKADKRRAILHENVIITATPDPELPCIAVSDVAAAYKAAHGLIRPWGDHCKVILVTGKENKTVTRQLIARVLESAGRVFTPADTEHITTAPWQDIHPSHDYCVLELQSDHPLGEEAADLIRPDITVCTDDFTPETATLSCPGLPFDYMAAAIGAAEKVGLSLGISKESIKKALAGYTFGGCTQTTLTADGVNITIASACKSVAAAESVLRAAAGGNLKIAVTTAEYQAVFAPWADKLIIVDEENPLLNAEKQLLAVLQEGASLILCGDRAADMPFLLRRLFGITDGFLYGGS